MGVYNRRSMTKSKVVVSQVETGYVASWIEADIAEIDIYEEEGVYRRLTCRVFGMNAPEPHGTTEESAGRARDRVSQLTQGKTLKFVFLYLPESFLIPPRFKKYGRTMVRVFLDDGSELATQLVEEGLAVPYYMGIGRQPNPLINP